LMKQGPCPWGPPRSSPSTATSCAPSAPRDGPSSATSRCPRHCRSSSGP
jgi:hypothetical protein